MALNVPPGRKGFLIELRETIAYLLDGDNFIKERTEEFGPVFSTTLFFRPTVVVGGQKNVAELLEVEQSVVAESSLPPPLQALMTDRNLLLQSGQRHAASRRMMAPILNADALKSYLPTIERRTEEYIAKLSQRDETYLAKDLVRFCLQLFAELFCGHALTEEEEELFTVYNGGLFALTTWEPSFVAARRARETLDANMRRRFEDARRDGLLETDRFAVFRHISSAVDEKGERSYDPGYGVTQLIWGAYIEAASLMCSSVRSLLSRPDCAARVRAEAAAAGVLGPSQSTRLGDWALPYATGVLRESLRVSPPAGGGFRLAGAPIQIGGYDIPAGVVVTADPRVNNRDPSLFPNPGLFEPERWVPAAAAAAGDGAKAAGGGGGRCPLASTAAQLSKAAWFPAGTGVHQCPGVPLAELACKVPPTTHPPRCPWLTPPPSLLPSRRPAAGERPMTEWGVGARPGSASHCFRGLPLRSRRAHGPPPGAVRRRPLRAAAHEMRRGRERGRRC